MDVTNISKLSGLELVNVEMVAVMVGEEGFKRIGDALDHLVNYVKRARDRGLSEDMIAYNIKYHVIRLYCAIKATKDSERETLGRALIKQIIGDEPTRSQLYVHLFDEGGVHEKLTLVKRPA